MATHSSVSGLFCSFVLIVLLSTGLKQTVDSARIFTIINDCQETIWPAVTPGDNFNGGGFPLKPHQSIVFTAPVGWSGRIWGRTGCNFDKNGNGTCQTGSCGSSLKCKASGKPPASLAEFSLASIDYYDCCRGVYGNPVVCQPTYYSKKFKDACPTAYSYAYDDPTSIYTCSGTDYVVTFCSSRFDS
ncbi:Thaumatin-like protein 1 [Linum perenne]